MHKLFRSLYIQLSCVVKYGTHFREAKAKDGALGLLTNQGELRLLPDEPLRNQNAAKSNYASAR